MLFPGRCSQNQNSVSSPEWVWASPAVPFTVSARFPTANPSISSYYPSWRKHRRSRPLTRAPYTEDIRVLTNLSESYVRKCIVSLEFHCSLCNSQRRTGCSLALKFGTLLKRVRSFWSIQNLCREQREKTFLETEFWETHLHVLGDMMKI